MKINELRLGNWISAYHGDVQVTRLALNAPHHESIYTTPNRIGASSGCIYTPIPLTEQWLKDFGFKITRTYSENREGLVRMSNGIFSFDSKPSRLFFVWDLKYEMKYVHTFQNVYFALTGEELIKK